MDKALVLTELREHVGLSTSRSTEAAELPVIEASGLFGNGTFPTPYGLRGDFLTNLSQQPKCLRGRKIT